MSSLPSDTLLPNNAVVVQAKLGPDQVMVPEVSSAVAGYTGALAACLQLVGPAVLHACKHGGEEGAWAPCVVHV
jgi:hypothetical protein